MKILADENMPKVEEVFAEFGEVSLCAGRDMSADDLQNTDVLLVRSITQVNQALLADSPVKFVGTATIGTDHIDLGYLKQKGIGFSNAPGCNADAVVDYVLSPIFQMADEQDFSPADRTYGIIGVGNVGRRLQLRLEKCGFNVLLNDPPRAKNEPGFVSLEVLLKEADFICTHTPLTKQGAYPSYHLLSKNELRSLKQNSVLLNAGRGPVIDNQALLEVGSERPDLSFVLDVWEDEPKVGQNLAERCSIVSPHIAGYSLEGKIRGTFMLYQSLCDFLGTDQNKSLVDFLPVAELNKLQQQDYSPLQIMHKVYNPLIDDSLLRETLSLESDLQQKAFDQLRKNYRIRREFSSLSISNPKQPKLLSAIGFQLAEYSELP